MIAGLILTELADRLNKPTITIEPFSRMLYIGFAVKVKNKTVRNAAVFCDGTKINWKELDGGEKGLKDLRAGEFSFFFPYRIEVSSVELKGDKQKIDVSIVQKMVTHGTNFTKDFERIIYRNYFNIPMGKFFGLGKEGDDYIYPTIHCEIHITGEEIEEEVNRLVDFPCWLSFQRWADSSKIEDLHIECRFGRKTKRFIL